ncbi:hypothetical protein L3Q67_34535 [Saccharothrix sp. AJ9571]|nr:hypothetical protein L3Q67_34535 [Saccharothrix sp. AJ9571]
MRTVLLAVFYYLVLTPASLLIRLFRDPLRRRADPGRTTYLISSGGSQPMVGIRGDAQCRHRRAAQGEE